MKSFRKGDDFVAKAGAASLAFANGFPFDGVKVLTNLLPLDATGLNLENGIDVDFPGSEELKNDGDSDLFEKGLLLEIGTRSRNSDFLEVSGVLRNLDANGFEADGSTGLTNA